MRTPLQFSERTLPVKAAIVTVRQLFADVFGMAHDERMIFIKYRGVFFQAYLKLLA
jgi:hypothetical protein